MSSPVSLAGLGGAYRRTSNRIYRILEDGYDYSVVHLIIDTLDQDALIIDAAFFVPVFGQVESRINAIAATHLASEADRQALRQQRFDRRLALALPGPTNAELRKDINDWSKVRNDAAHGRELTGSYVIPEILERAHQLEALLAERLAGSGDAGKEPT
jgi:hypothetical protein